MCTQLVRGGSFIQRLPTPSTGLRLGVKDVIEVAGVRTTCGSAVLAERAEPAPVDATCVAMARAAGVVVAGKTNLVELALGAHGINPWFGTPSNPLGTTLIPGGSSSGSAVAVATGEVDVAYGTDTGGSIRIPAACCGIVGFKPGNGVVPMDGVVPLAPSLDCVGPMATSVAMIERAMSWLVAGWESQEAWEPRRALLVTAGASPAVAQATRQTLLDAEVEFEERASWGWEEAWRAGGIVLEAEAAGSFRHLDSCWARVDPSVVERLERGCSYSQAVVDDARRVCARWRERMRRRLGRDGVVVTPTLPAVAPTFETWPSVRLNWFTLPVNVAGLPAIAVPVIRSGHVPMSVQMIAGPGGERSLLAAARHLEESMGA